MQLKQGGSLWQLIHNWLSNKKVIIQFQTDIDTRKEAYAQLCVITG